VTPGPAWRWRRRVPTVLQMEAVECGAASLAMVLAYHRRWVSLEALRDACRVSRDGARAGNIVRAARDYGMQAEGRGITAEEIDDLALPAIVYWNRNHFLVVERAGRKSVTLCDPASGRRRVPREEFARSYSGIAIELQPGPGFRRGGTPPQVFRPVLRQLLPDRASVVMAMALTLLAVLPGLLLPAALKAFTDDVLTRQFDDWLLPVALVLLATAATAGLLRWLQQQVLLKLGTAVAARLSLRLMQRLLELPYLYFTQRHAADLAMRVGLCQQLAQTLSGPLPTTLAGLITAGMFSLLLLFHSPELTAVALGLSALNLGAALLRQRSLFDMNAVALSARARLLAVSAGGLAGIETLKAQGGEDAFFRLWCGRQVAFAGTTQRLSVTAMRLSLLPAALGAATTPLILGTGAWLIMRGELTIGGLLAFQVLVGQVTGPLQAVQGLGDQLQQVKASFLRIQDVLEHGQGRAGPAAPALLSPPAAAPAARLTGHIAFEAVSACYGPGAPLVLRDLFFRIAPGERVAFVGATGSGKSTLLRLLSRTIDPAAGRILFDGQDLAALPPEAFAASVSVVEQETQIFAGSVADNLTMWDPTCDPAAVAEACRDACIHDTIAALPGGYAARLDEGGLNLSGGQRQRLEIARALVKRPTVMILDEATSALDPVTEKTVMDNLRRRGCTCVIVAHRLSTIRDCDRIHVLEGGGVIEQGTHEALLAAGGRYAALVAAT